MDYGDFSYIVNTKEKLITRMELIFYLACGHEDIDVTVFTFVVQQQLWVCLIYSVWLVMRKELQLEA